MFVAGDEVRRTQHGNNNAYCQDNALSWFDWTLAEKNGHLLRFFQQMIAFRKRHPILHRSRFFTGEVERARPARHHLARLPAERAGLGRPDVARRWRSRWAASGTTRTCT